MRVLVAGGTEFISLHLVRALLRDGHGVSVLNRGRQPGRLPGGVRASVVAMDAVTGPYDFIAVVDGNTLDAIGTLVTDSIGVIDGVTRTTTCVAVSIG